MAAKAVLLLGLDPEIVDYSKSPVPGLTAAKVHSAVEGEKRGGPGFLHRALSGISA
jgi:hypothetical protein